MVVASPVDDLPLIVEAPQSAGAGLAVFVSGDGGWAALDREVTQSLLEAGYGVVGLDASRYFRAAKTPDELARDLDAISRFYLDTWNRADLLLLGYSRGADVLPFSVPLLPKELTARLHAVVLLAPALYTSFKFRFADLWSNRRHSDSVDTLPAAAKVEQRIICFFGADEDDSLCPSLHGQSNRTVVELDGGHHFDGDYAGLGDKILALLGSAV